MPFFDKVLTDSEQEDSQFVARLKKILKKNPRAGKTQPDARWMEEIRLLKKRVGAARINKALEWLALEIGNKYTPAVSSPITFREKFDQIETLVNKALMVVPDLAISPEAHEISDEYELIWPGNEKAAELEFIQTSLNNYRAFLDHIGKGLESATSPRLKQCLENFIDHASPPKTAISGYLLEVHRMAHKWRKWRGELIRWVWTQDSRIWREETENWLNSFGSWSLLESAINAN